MMKNSKGKIWYGMHFYPGVAEYQEAGADPYRVFLNEDTIRSMDPSFAGRPIFVNHVDEVDENIDELKKEADGWVVESFYNSADGKHWAKFIVVSERGEIAIQRGMRLSNAYVPKSFGQGGLWNGVSYAKEITGGEYDHLAIVSNPRYEESVIMSPEQFKKYNDDKMIELKRLSNGKDEKEKKEMKLNFFKRAKVENAVDLESMSVVLPKSGKEMTITELVNAMDEKEMDRNSGLADMAHKVKMDDGSYCNVAELMEKHKAMNAELEELKKKKEDEMESDDDSDKKDDVENADDEDDKKKLKLEESKEKEIEDAKKKNELEKAREAKKEAAKAKAEALKNAPFEDFEEDTARVETSVEQIARGKARYGSN